MSDLNTALRQLGSDLRSGRVPFALVGGLAVAIRAEPRLTRDADVAISTADDKAAEAVVRAMIDRGYLPGAVLEQENTGRLATVRFTHSDRPKIIVDLLFASCGIEPEIVARAEELEVLKGFVIPVARTGHLIAMKLLARDDRRRANDADDLRGLAAVADDEEWQIATDAVRLITERGFARDRDLPAALAELRQ